MVMIYTIEAHPVDTMSPCSIKNDIWVTKENIRDGILAENPRTYGDRREICTIWQDKYDLKPIILVDSPNNKFWLTYGQAPNLAYLINPDKTVFWRQIFLHQESLEVKIKILMNSK